jgi:hypothetical protein
MCSRRTLANETTIYLDKGTTAPFTGALMPKHKMRECVIAIEERDQCYKTQRELPPAEIQQSESQADKILKFTAFAGGGFVVGFLLGAFAR